MPSRIHQGFWDYLAYGERQRIQAGTGFGPIAPFDAMEKATGSTAICWRSGIESNSAPGTTVIRDRDACLRGPPQLFPDEFLATLKSQSRHISRMSQGLWPARSVRPSSCRLLQALRGGFRRDGPRRGRSPAISSAFFGPRTPKTRLGCGQTWATRCVAGGLNYLLATAQAMTLRSGSGWRCRVGGKVSAPTDPPTLIPRALPGLLL